MFYGPITGREAAGREALVPQTGLAPRRPEAALLRVLVAEDNGINRLVVATLLRRAGHEVLEAADGLQALELWRTERPDLVLMDMQMPQCDGLTCTRRLRAEEASSGQPRTPVVALTSNAFEEDRRECLAAGMDAHLSKPIRPAELSAILEHYGTSPSGSTYHASTP